MNRPSQPRSSDHPTKDGHPERVQRVEGAAVLPLLATHRHVSCVPSNSKLSTAWPELCQMVNSISLTPLLSVFSALSQKLDFPQTFSNLSLAHSFAKHPGVGGPSFKVQTGGMADRIDREDS